jgi:hypothetical protein
MRSWMIWERLIALKHDPLDNPIVMRTAYISTPPRWMGVPSLRRAAPGLLVVLALHALIILFGQGQWNDWFLTLAVVLVVAGMIFGPSLVLWTLPLALALGPAIVREREDRTWDLLRTTPLDLNVLLLGKIQGGLWWLRDAIRSLTTIILLAGLIVTVLVMAANNTLFRSDCETACQFMLWGWMPLGLVLFVVDRMQQFALMITVALASSAATRTTRTGLVVGTLATFGVWLAEIVLGLLVLLIYPGQTISYWTLPVTAMIALGPVGGYLFEMPLSVLVLAMVSTLLLREMVFRWMWHFTICAAGRCERDID